MSIRTSLFVILCRTTLVFGMNCEKAEIFCELDDPAFRFSCLISKILLVCYLSILHIYLTQ